MSASPRRSLNALSQVLGLGLKHSPLVLGVVGMLGCGLAWGAGEAEDDLRIQDFNELFEEAPEAPWQIVEDAVYQGDEAWVRLTENLEHQVGALIYDQAFERDVGVDVAFRYYMEKDVVTESGGPTDDHGADGLAFFLFDGSHGFSGLGPAGGALGYGRASDFVDPENDEHGLPHAYMGLGFDLYGGFTRGEGSYDTENRNQVTLRGPGHEQEGYEKFASEHFWVANSQYIDVRVVLTDQQRLLVFVRNVGDGATWSGTDYWGSPIIDIDYAAAIDAAGFVGPDTLKFGFAAATGGLTNVHAVEQVALRTVSDLPTISEEFASEPETPWDLGGGDQDSFYDAPNERLVLTEAGNDQVGYLLYDRAFSREAGLDLTFAYTMEDPDGADGLSFFLMDGLYPVNGIGPSGGDLGYSNTAGDGLPRAVLGLGFDRYGNFSDNPDPAGDGGTTSDHVVLRGSGHEQTGYEQLAATPFADMAGGERLVNVVLSEDQRLTVRISTDDGESWTPLFEEFDIAAENTGPHKDAETLKFGFAASTGSVTNLHAINRVSVNAESNMEVSVSIEPEGTGTVTGAGIYNDGDEAQLNATPEENHLFVEWRENGTNVSEEPEYTFTVDVTNDGESRDLVAHFEPTFAGGNGSAGNPFVIASPDQLQRVGEDPDAHYVLDGDVDVSGIDWEPIGSTEEPFTGSLTSSDGTNRNVSGLNGQPLFGVIGAGAEVSALTIEGSINDDAGSNAGLLANAIEGEEGNPAKINAVQIDDQSSITGDSFIGGLAGTIEHAEIDGVIIDADVTGSGNHVGGVGGTIADSDIDNTTVNGDVEGNDYVGGVGGQIDDSNLSNVKVNGGVQGEGSNVGGVGGQLNRSENANCVLETIRSNGSVSGGNKTGGVGGSIDGCSVSDVEVNGDVTGGDETGGVGGHINDSEIDDATIKGNVKGNNKTGGVGGRIDDSTVKNSEVTEEATVEGAEEVGGIGGAINDSTIENSTVEGDVAGEQQVGGIYGSESGSTLTGNTDNASVLGSEDTPYLITEWGQLHAVRNNPGAYYRLDADLDSGSAGYGDYAASDANDGNGWQPIAHFSGQLDGNGHTLTGLRIDRAGESDVGLFAELGADAVVEDLTLADVDIVGGDQTGTLAARSRGEIENVRVTGRVEGDQRNTGGLIALVTGGSVVDSSTDVEVVKESTATGNSGGLIGDLVHSGDAITVENVHAEGDVTTQGGNAGGLVGLIEGDVTLRDASASGSVFGVSHQGGLVGYIGGGGVERSFATGTVGGSSHLGGLVGEARDGHVSDSYATGAVGDGSSETVGGLIGSLGGNSALSSSYARGAVQGSSSIGGLLGSEGGSTAVAHAYFDSTVNEGMADDEYGRTTEQLRQLGTFAGDWDIGVSGDVEPGYPRLSWQEDGVGGQTWVIYPFGAGDGTAESPYEIADAEQMALVGDAPGAYYVLTDDVDLSGVAWEPIGSEAEPFTGSLASSDGDQRSISGLDGKPLFDVIGPGAEVSDIEIAGSVNDDADEGSGLLANAIQGEADNRARIDNVTIDGDSRIDGGANDVIGGLAGSIDHAELSNIAMDAEVHGRDYVGGLAGTIRHSTIVDTEVTGDVSATGEPVGGLAAELVDTEVTDSRVSGTVNDVAPSDDATLSALVPSAGNLAPAFDPATLAYDVAVSHAVDRFSVTPTLSDSDARITVDGERVESGTGSPEMSLAVGSQTLELVVTAPDWSTSTYAVTVTRAAAPAPTPPEDDDEPVQDENVQEVSETIGSLPPVDELTLEHRGAIEDARAAYEALDPEQQAQVDNLDDLIAAEERLEELLAEQSGGIVDESGQALGDRTVATGEPVRFRLDVSDDVALAISGTVRRGTETRDLPSGIAPTLLRDPDSGAPVLRLEDGTYVFESERGGTFTLVFTGDDGVTYSVRFDVRPQVAFTSTRQFGTAGESVEVRAVLEGTPAQYPVIVSYALTGSELIETAEPGLQTAGEFRFVAEGEHARLRTLNLTPNARTGEITLALRAGQGSDYALPGDPAEHRILLREAEEVPLAVHLEVEQDGRTIRDGVVTQADGPVTLRVDPEIGLAFDWSDSDLDLEIHQATGSTVTFVPQGLDGVYHARLRVTEIDEPGRVATLEQRLRVVADRDAIPPAYRDFYSDDPDQWHVLPICRDGTFRPVGPGLCAEDSREVPVVVPEGYQVRLGLYSEAASWASGRFGLGITPDDLRDTTGEPALNQDDPSYDHHGYLVDFEIFDLQHPGQAVPAVIPLPEGREIPEQAVWRKWRPAEGWQDFVVDDANQLHSAPITDAGCPWPGSDRWTGGLTEGDHCVRLIIEDGGPNDLDGERDGVIRDPGTLATPVGTGDSPGDGGEGGGDRDDTESRGGGGASGPLLLLGLLGLGLLARTRRRLAVAR